MASPQIAQTGLIDLLFQAGLMAKFVLLVLLSASIVCWAIILSKWRALQRASRENRLFLNMFWHSKSVDEIFTKAEKYSRSPVATVFKAGYKELRKLSGNDLKNLGSLAAENIHRSLLRTSNAEIAIMEKQIGWLATTASASPFIGLFGTVWGIMTSFQSIGSTGAANLAIVAPGISEALITTAAGIGVAVPAVIAYNYFAGQIRRLATDIDCFSQDFINIVQRNALGGQKGD